MNNLFKGLIAGWGAAKFGGGCLGTILVFAIIWALLGTCDDKQAQLKWNKPVKNNICLAETQAMSSAWDIAR